MDHHCGFTGNCVGPGTVKPFMLFCFYSIVTCFLGVCVIIKYTIKNGIEDKIHLSPFRSFLIWNTWFIRKAVCMYLEKTKKESLFGFTVESLGFGKV